ncbi:hypothetical protein [Neobacillus cucumis]|uniref:hypothetical protein n=1 Tax=Neobacillus cucumis TaxID=1740721 RepID=UPI00285353B4|nr:hypothetical protein [Neobacillus cucumis]MDR4947070.1 hypothetical protein [Neobacillus cucumis]
MYKNIGIVAVTSEGAALCYKNIVSESMKRVGKNIHPEISLHNVSFSDYYQLIPGKYNKKSIENVITIINRVKSTGCDAVALACTELPIIIDEKNSPLPVLDTTNLLSKSALDFAINK